MINTVIKRDGNRVNFDRNKVYKVIEKAFRHNDVYSTSLFNTITNNVIKELEEQKKEEATVEQIQEVVENCIALSGFEAIANLFSNYKKKKEKERRSRENLYEQIATIAQTTDRENANVGNSPSAKLLQIAEIASRKYSELELVDEEVSLCIENNKIYPHDFAWNSVGTTTCSFIPFDKLLKEGFNPGHGYIRSPKRIRTASQLMCIIFQSNQNDQHGGQASGWLEKELAPYVKLEYQHQHNLILQTLKALEMKGFKEDIERLAWERTEEETFQAMESLIFNLNTMHSRAGSQVPFTSINIGTGVTKEERMIIKNVLLAYKKGLGKGEQPKFPNIVFKVKDGVNYEPGTPNHDMFRLAMAVSAKRFFPTFNFQDCSLNKGFPEDIPGMGCRTQVRWNRHKPKDGQTCLGRGNLSFTTINTPGIALKCKYGDYSDIRNVQKRFYEIDTMYDIRIPNIYCNNLLIKKYFVMLNEFVDISISQLISRFKYQCTFTVKDFPFLMNGVWMESEKLNPNDKIGSVLKHGTLGIGFIGIAETLKCLVGKHHGESDEALQLGVEIVKFIHEKVKEASDINDLNFSVIATPAEGLTGKLASKDREIYGVIEGVTDKEWYTNSSHIPVEYKISIFDKIKREGLFTKYCTGGSITYVELSESPEANVEAIYSIVQAMHDNDISVGAINFPADRCISCGEFGLIEGDSCPVCGSNKISRIRRITGYLAELNNFNSAKYQEAIHRVKHDK